MEDRETARMRKYGESKRLELWWQLYCTSLPVRDLENFRPMDFYWHECTYTTGFTLSDLDAWVMWTTPPPI